MTVQATAGGGVLATVLGAGAPAASNELALTGFDQTRGLITAGLLLVTAGLLALGLARRHRHAVVDGLDGPSPPRRDPTYARRSGFLEQVAGGILAWTQAAALSPALVQQGTALAFRGECAAGLTAPMMHWQLGRRRAHGSDAPHRRRPP